MIGLKIRYREPTPKMIVRAALDASRPHGSTSNIESKSSLEARQYFAEQRRRQRYAEQNAAAELRVWEATQAAAEHPWTRDSTITFILLIVSIIIGYWGAFALTGTLGAFVLGPLFTAVCMFFLDAIFGSKK